MADNILVALLIGALFAFALAGRAWNTHERAQATWAWVGVGVVLASGFGAYFVSNYDQLRLAYDYPATYAALEQRYDVTLSPQSTQGRTFPPPRGKTSTVNQDRFGPVTLSDGTVIDDVYIQWSTGQEPRVALVLPEPGTNTLAVTRSTWWPELPVADPAS